MSLAPVVIGRRRLLVLLGAVALLPFGATAAPASLEATPRDTEGPFYPSRLPVDQDGDLTRVTGHTKEAQGTRLYLSGRVLATTGAPLPGARVELWQCDATGHYHHVDGDRPGDPDFQGYGVVISDADGRYAFKTIRPVPYGSRPAHLHFKLSSQDAAPLTTQLYVRGDGDRGDPVAAFGGRRTRDRLMIVLTPTADKESGAVSARYDFVLASRSS